MTNLWRRVVAGLTHTGPGYDPIHDKAVQIAHRPGLSTELRDALTTAVRGAVNLALDEREFNDTHLLHDSSKEAPR